MLCPELSAEEYRRLKDLAVYNLEGTTPHEVFLQIIAMALGISALKTALSWWKGVGQTAQAAIEIAFLVPTLLCVFTWPESLVPICCISTALLIGSHFAGRKQRDTKALYDELRRPRKDYVGDYRAAMMVMVVCGILAVDFNVFPRKYAKTEMFGTGTMDAGVGSLVLANGIVAAHTIDTRVRKAMVTSVPLILLGVGRLASVKAADYHEHVSEYGVHWNFFFTLAGISLLGSILTKTVPHRLLPYAGVVLLMIHEYGLIKMDVLDWVLNAPRTDFISANKEGIVSLPGYLGLYLVGLGIGGRALAQRSPAEWHIFVWELAGGAAVAAGLMYSLEVNITYVLWVMAGTLSVLAILLAAHLYALLRPVPLRVSAAINRNQLAIFLIANLMTGMVNMGMRTLCATNEQAYAVLAVYMVAVLGIAIVLHDRGISLKFW